MFRLWIERRFSRPVTAAGAVLKPQSGNCAVLPLESTKDPCGSLPYILLVLAKYLSFSLLSDTS